MSKEAKWQFAKQKTYQSGQIFLRQMQNADDKGALSENWINRNDKFNQLSLKKKT